MINKCQSLINTLDSFSPYLEEQENKVQQFTRIVNKIDAFPTKMSKELVCKILVMRGIANKKIVDLNTSAEQIQRICSNLESMPINDEIALSVKVFMLKTNLTDVANKYKNLVQRIENILLQKV